MPAKILYRLCILLLLAHHPQTPFPSPYPPQRLCYEWPIPLYRGRLRKDFACRRNLKQSVLSFSGKEYARMDKTLSFGRRWSHAHSNALVAEAVFDTVLACDWGSNLPHRVIEPTRPCHQSVRPKLSCRRCRDVTSLQLKFRFRSDLIKSICTFGSAKSLLCRNASGQD